MCFTDLTLRIQEMSLVGGDVANVIREGALRAGFTDVTFVDSGTMRTLFPPVIGPGVMIGKVITQLHVLAHVDLDKRCPDARPYTGSTLYRSCLSVGEIEMQTVFVKAPGHKRHLFHIPSIHLLRHYFESTSSSRYKKMRVPLDGLKGAYFPFEKYEDAWGHFTSQAQMVA